jgi:hypothetical protein
MAIMAFERRDRRGYQFQDGELRVFKKGYYDLFEPVKRDDINAQNIVKNLKSMLKQANIAREYDLKKRGNSVPAVDFTALHDIFVQEYPKGFSTDEYLKKIRGRDQKRRIKRHRDKAIIDARERLSPNALHAMAEAGDHAGVRDTLLDVLTKTDLVTKKKLEPLRKLEERDLPVLTRELRNMLYGTGPYEARFERFVNALARSGEKVSWSLATAPSALIRPEECFYVKASVSKELVKRYSPNIGWNTRPTGWLYGRIAGIAHELAEQAKEAGDAPSDLLDVAWLVWTVLRPKGRKKLDAAVAAAAEAEADAA